MWGQETNRTKKIPRQFVCCFALKPESGKITAAYIYGNLRPVIVLSRCRRQLWGRRPLVGGGVDLDLWHDYGRRLHWRRGRLGRPFADAYEA